jgi:hypothetical protein
MALLDTLKKPYWSFWQTLAEGNYRPERASLWSRIFDWSPPNTPAQNSSNVRSVGSVVLGSSKNLANRLFGFSLFTFVATRNLMKTGALLGGAGTLLYGIEYLRARHARKKIIREQNFVGQTVEGTRADLYRLNQVQTRILHIQDEFARVATCTTSDMVKRLIDSVQAERKRVKVIDAGVNGAKTSMYDFSEHAIKLAEDGDPQPKSPLPPLDRAQALQAAWSPARLRSMADRIAALEDEVPKPMMREARRRMREIKRAHGK